jgi:hypothetical protein
VQGISGYRLKIRARKQKALEAKWKQEAAAKQSQAQNAALAAKIARMEREEERKGQRTGVSKPLFDMANWKRQEYAQPSTSRPGVPTSGTHNFSRKPKSVTAQPAKPGLWNRFTSAATNTVKKFVTPVVNTVRKFVTPVVKKVVTPVVSAVKKVVAPVVHVWNAVKKWIPGLGWLADKVKKTVVEPVTRFVSKTVPNFVTKTIQAGWNFVTKTVPHFVTKTTQTGWEYLQQTRQSLDDLWHRRSVRIALAATAIAVAAPTWFSSVNLATNLVFRVPAVTWFGVGSEWRGVETALANQTAVQDVVNNYNAVVASGTTFICEYNQKGKPREECVRSVEISPTLVEAAIAVQSQWKIPWLDSSLLRWIQGREHSSEGIAQVSQPELEQWADNLKKYLPPGASLSPQDVHASAGAVIERIAPVLEYCQQRKCDPNSQVIVAAMAQNGKGFTVDALQEIYKRGKYLNQYGSINWEKYFEAQGLRPIEGNLPTRFSRLVQNLRAMPGNFERQFMLQLYVNDLKLLQAKGETLPEGVDLKYLECLADRLPGASYHCESEKEN